ncbi:hypothetical protein FJD35_11570 [Pseudomonas mandelii]|nr:hypothetical protein FJD35_11570 [Pseudomonas mandelii]
MRPAFSRRVASILAPCGWVRIAGRSSRGLKSFAGKPRSYRVDADPVGARLAREGAGSDSRNAN